MNKKNFVILLLIALISWFMYLKYNPPLYSPGLTVNPKTYKDVIIELRNSGFSDIRLKKVLINEGEIPLKAKLAVGRGIAVNALGLYEESPYITFHSLDKYKIHPESNLPTYIENIENKKISHYGVRINHNKPISKIIIIYRYLGVAFKLEEVISTELH